MRTRAWTWVVSALAAQAAVGQTAKADQGEAVVIGTVRDADTRGPIAKASVTVTREDSIGEPAVVFTNLRGRFRLPSLSPGMYAITVACEGYEDVTRTGVILVANTEVRIDTLLSPPHRTVTFVLAPTINVRSAATTMWISSALYDRVPVANPGVKGGAVRSFESVAEVIPGARNDTYGTSIAGTTSPENNYVIDGITVSNPAYGINGSGLSVEFLQEVDVDSGGYMPEYGRSTGGIVSAVTQSGGSKLHGSAWGFYTPGQLEGQRHPVKKEGSALLADESLGWIGDVGFDIGGPIVRDRLWFYGGFLAARSSTNVKTSWYRNLVDPDTGEAQVDPVTGSTLTERIPGTEIRRKAQATTVQVLGKLTLRANRNHQFDLLGLYIPSLSGSNGNWQVDPRTGQPDIANPPLGQYSALSNEYRDDASDMSFTWWATNDDKKWSFDTKIGWHHQRSSSRASDGSRIGDSSGLAAVPGVIYRRNDPGPHSILDFEDLPAGAPAGSCAPVEVPDPNDPEATIRTETCPVTTYSINGPGFLYERQLQRVQGRHVITRWASGAGRHVIKGGIDVEYQHYTNLRGFSGGVLYRENTSGTQLADFRQQGFLVSPDEAVIVPTLQGRTSAVTGGAFLQDSWFIMDKVTLNAGLRYDAQFLFAAETLGLALPNQISPRLGLIWDPSYQEKSKIFASYARFYQNVPLALADLATSGHAGVTSYHDAMACDPSDTTMASGVCTTNDTRVPVPFSGPTTNDQRWSATGASRTPIDPKIKPQSSGELVFGGEYEVFAFGRLGVTYTRRWLDHVIEDMSRDEANTYFVGNPGHGIAKDFPKAERKYDAVIVYLHKRFFDHWLVSASYTMSWLRGNIAGLFRPETGQLSPNHNSDFDLRSLLANRFGPLPGDHRHDIKLFGAGEIPLTDYDFLLVGGAVRARSGGPTSVLGSHLLYGESEAFILPRGSGERLPWSFSVDTNVGFRHQLSRDLALTISVDVFNALNLQSATAVDQNYTFQDVIPIRGGTMTDLAALTDVEGTPVVKNPNFGKPIAYQRPRTFRFGIRFEF